MDVFVARQAVFDRCKQVVAYELLFRATPDAVQTRRSDLMATTHVLSSGFCDIGLEKLLDGEKALVNVPADLLVSDFVRALPKDVIMLEILETVTPDAQVLKACAELKELGFTLVLDDYTGQPELEPLIEWVDWVKVDFRAISLAQAEEIAGRLKPLGKILLAEKVETEEEFDAAASAGYCYFQGFFLQKPRLVMGRAVPTRSVQLLQVLSLLSANDEPDLAELESAISRDVGLSLKLVRYSNTAKFSGNISSLRECMVRLGSLETRRFVSILAFPQLSAEECPELVEQAVVRGRMCEALASAILRDDMRPQAFLVGMFSLLEAIMRVPLSEIVRELALSPDLTTALLDEDSTTSTLASLLRVVKAYETAALPELNSLAGNLRIPIPKVIDAYMDAIQ